MPSSATYQQAGITAGTSGGSGTGDITFSAGSSTACSINPTTGAVSITSGTGTCMITATKAADTNYNSATSAGVSITVSKATPTATLAVNNSPVPYDGSPHSATVEITTSSVPGSVINILTGGATSQTNVNTYAVTADFAPTDSTNYNTLTSLSAGNFVISKANQATLTVTGLPSSATYQQAGITAGTSGGSGTGDITFSAGSSTACSINPTTGAVSITSGTGTCMITATKAEDSNYNQAISAEVSITINKANQATLNFTGQTVTYPEAFATLSTTGGSGTGTVTYAVTTAGTAGCSIVDATLSYTSVGTCGVTATKAADTNYNIASSSEATFTIVEGALDHFAISNISTQTAGTPFDITITAKDAGNNTIASFTSTVDLSNLLGGIVPATSSHFSGGILTQSVTLTKAGSDSITATSLSKTGTSNTFTVNPGALDHFVFDTISGQTAGASFPITVTAKDANNNTVTGYMGTANLTTTAGTINPATSNAFMSGVLTQSFSVTQAGSGKTITITDGGATGTSNTFTVDAGPVAQFFLNDPGDMYAKTRLAYSVTRKDAFGNLVSSGTTTVNLHTSSTSSTKKFYDDSLPLPGAVVTSIDIAPGHSSANFGYYDEEPGTYTITASATDITDGTDSVVVMPVAIKFVIINPTDGTVDAPITVTVQAQKPDNSKDTNYQQDVTLNVSGSAKGPGGLVNIPINIINGEGSTTISDMVAETVTLSLTDSQSTGLDYSSTQDVVFAGGVTAQFSLSNPVTSEAGSRVQYTVSRFDQYNNLTTQGTTRVYLYSTHNAASKKFYDVATGGVPVTYIDILDGQSSVVFWYYDEIVGTYTIAASDNSSGDDGNVNINDAYNSISIVAGPIYRFFLNNPGDTSAGSRIGYSVTRQDQFYNPVTIGSVTVNLFSSSPNGFFFGAATDGSPITSIDITAGNSSANFWYFDATAGTDTITASDSTSVPDTTGIVDSSDDVVINAVPVVATRFVILNPIDGTVEAPITVTVQAQDNSGNVDTTYQNDVTLHTTGSATGAGLVNIVDGSGSLNISDTKAQTVNLSLTDSEHTGLDTSFVQDVVFSEGSVSQFSLNNPGDMSAGTRIGYTVTRKDVYGNIVYNGLTKVYLYGLPAESSKKFYDAASGGSVISFVNITNGNSTADFWYYDEHAGASSVVASDNSSAPDGTEGIDDVSDNINVSAGPVAKFILNNPGDMSVGTRLDYTVKRQDQFGNLATSGVTVVYLYTSSSGSKAKFYDNATGGLAVTSIAIDDGNSSADFWYYDETAGTWVITVSDSTPTPNGATGVIDDADSVTVSTIPIVATRFVITNSPEASQINVPIVITVKAEDANGNVDATYQSDVTLVASGSVTGAGLVDIVNGVGTLSINDATAETILLTLSDTEATGLDVNSSVNMVFTTLPPAFHAGGGAAPVPQVSKVSFSGIAYPGATLSIAAIAGTENIVKQGTASLTDGSFKITFTGLSTGSRSYALLIKDKDGRIAQSKVYDLNLLNADSVLEVNDILISPTIGFSRSTVTKGDFLAIAGFAAPKNKLSVQVDGQEITADIVALADGGYSYLYSTAFLPVGSHTIRALQITSDGTKSEFSPQKVFFTTSLSVPKTDFNNDGKLDISDWSIFLANWVSTDPAVRLLDDLNNDGKVDASDFSIFIRTLRQ